MKFAYLWYSKLQAPGGRPWRVRFEDGREIFCSRVKLPPGAHTAQTSKDEHCEALWVIAFDSSQAEFENAVPASEDVRRGA